MTALEPWELYELKDRLSKPWLRNADKLPIPVTIARRLFGLAYVGQYGVEYVNYELLKAAYERAVAVRVAESLTR